MARETAFTIVELLVVVAIVSVLAALLLPGLEQSLEQARRIRCLNDKKQLGLTVTAFANDHRGLIPHCLNSSDSTIMYDEIYSRYDTSMTQRYYAATIGVNVTNPTGTLIRRGYIEEPDILFDPAHPRGHSHPSYGRPPAGVFWEQWHYDESPYRANWKTYAMSGFTSVAHTMGQFSDLKRGVSPEHTYRNVTLQFLAEYWNRDCIEIRGVAMAGTPFNRKDQVGPILYACLNGPVHDGWPDDNVSHMRAGVNAVFYDGAARWIPAEETGWRLWNDDPHLSNFQQWQRQLMTAR